MNEFSGADAGYKHTHIHPHRHTLVIAEDFEDQSDWWTLSLSSCLSVTDGVHGDGHHKVGNWLQCYGGVELRVHMRTQVLLLHVKRQVTGLIKWI